VFDEIEAIKKGCYNLIEEDELSRKLERGKLKVKFGIDPTAPSLHLGHLTLFLKAKEFQKYGHKIILIVGDFTALVGDPSGRSALRPVLSKEEVKKNAQQMLNQIFRFIDPKKCEILYNATWFSRMKLDKIFNMLSKFTVSRILSREEFRERMSENKPLFLHEFLYPILQGYDSVVTEADVEIGGHDQLFNLIFARDMMKSFNMEPQVCLTLPLLEGTDGRLKMSKTYGNYISVDERPEDVFGKLMGIPDKLIPKYSLLLTENTEEAVQKMQDDISCGRLHPFHAKQKLAWDITALLWGEESANGAKEWFDKVIREKKIPNDIPQASYKGERWLPKVLKDVELVTSTSEALRLVEQGGIVVDGEKVSDRNFCLERGIHFIRVGKTRFLKLEVL
jgi:tyrosyl-tRNA synthetase